MLKPKKKRKNGVNFMRAADGSLVGYRGTRRFVFTEDAIKGILLVYSSQKHYPSAPIGVRAALKYVRKNNAQAS